MSLVYFLIFNVGFVLIAAGLTALAVRSGEDSTAPSREKGRK